MKKILFLGYVLLCNISFATTLLVTNTNDAGAGSLRDIMQGTVIQNGDTVRFDPNLIANGSDTIVLLSTTFTSKDITIIGLYNATDTLFLSGGGTKQIMYVDHPNTTAPKAKLVIDSLVMIDGSSSRGGHLYFRGDTLIIKNSIFRNGRSSTGTTLEGGSLWLDNQSNSPAVPSFFEFTNCTFYNNIATKGGAVFTRLASDLTIINCKFYNNSGTNGGALCTEDESTVNITNSVFNNNTAGDRGGAVFSTNRSNWAADFIFLNIDNSTFYNNSALNGGAVATYNIIADVQVNTSTFANNTVTNEGGAISLYSTGSAFNNQDLKLTLINSTVTKNSTTTGGISSGVLIRNQFSLSRSYLSIKGSIIADNGIGGPVDKQNVDYRNVNSNFTSNGHNLIGDSSISGAPLASTDRIGVTGAQLNLGILQDNGGYTPTMVSGTGSIAINRGDTLDLSNAQNGPITDGFRDIGAAEFYCVINKTINTQACKDYTTPSGNNTYSASGTYYDTLSAGGCDTLYTINLSINNSSVILSEVSCGDYVSPSGKIFTSTGQYFDTISNTKNCDSLITIFLTISSETTSSISPVSCGDYTSPSGKLVTSSSNFNDTILNGAGCDSVITISLTVNQPSTSISNITECASYISPTNKVYSATGQYFDTLQNAVNCDSIITTNLVINQTSSTIQVASCGDYTSPSGKLYTSSGTYKDTLVNQALCDSVITVNLTVTNVSSAVSQSSITLNALQNGASYKWLDCNNGNSVILGETNQSFTATVNGSYAVEVNLNNCIDTSSCFNISSVGVLSNSITNDLIIFPNPVQNLLHLKTSEQVNNIEVFTLEGKLIISNTNKTAVDVSILLSGTYIINIQTENGSITKRFIKK